MKHHGLLRPALALCLILSACPGPEDESPLPLDFPPLPAPWTELLGPPRWLVRYYSDAGLETSLETGGEGAELALPLSRVSPVLAWPYWPERRLRPGDFRPAGGILPYDARFPGGGRAPGRLSLSWEGGVAAWFFETLDQAAAGGREERWWGRDFDWPRFRALLADPQVLEKLRSDPWLADWDAVAGATLRSGFRSQWLKAVETSPLSVPVAPGPWISPSPFAPPVLAGIDSFEVPGDSAPRAWYSAGGILHCAGSNWILLPWE
jgi:hypothetical protein